MKFKIILFIALAIIVSCSSPASESVSTEEKNTVLSEEELKTQYTKDITTYLKAFNNKEWQAVVDMINPKLFKLMPQSQMIETFDKLGEMGMDMKTQFDKIEKLTQVITHEKAQYCRVYYNGGITIKLSGEMLANKEQLTQSFMDAYGAENVQYDGIDQFDIVANKSMIAVLEEDAKEWKYIEYNTQQNALLNQLIPKEVIKQIID